MGSMRDRIGLAAPLVEELAGPGERIILPELLKSLLHKLEHYCRDLNGWPRAWMGLEKDLPGEKPMTLFRPFLEQLAASNLSLKTIQKHADNMWALGREFIRDLQNEPTLKGGPWTRSFQYD